MPAPKNERVKMPAPKISAPKGFKHSGKGRERQVKYLSYIVNSGALAPITGRAIVAR